MESKNRGYEYKKSDRKKKDSDEMIVSLSMNEIHILYAISVLCDIDKINKNYRNFLSGLINFDRLIFYVYFRVTTLKFRIIT